MARLLPLLLLLLGGRALLRHRRRRARALSIVLRLGALVLRSCRASLLRRCGRSLHRRRLVVLAHDGVTRLVAVVLASKLLLLLDLLRIAIPRVLPLVSRQRRWRSTKAHLFSMA